MGQSTPYAFGLEELGGVGACLYFVSSDGYCKIGRASEFKDRLSSLQTGTPSKLLVEGILPGMGWQEKLWHLAFAHLRHRGEWFEWTDELQEAVAAALCGEEWIATLRAHVTDLPMHDSPWRWQVPFLVDQSPQGVADFLWRNMFADAEEDLLEGLLARRTLDRRGAQVSA